MQPILLEPPRHGDEVEGIDLDGPLPVEFIAEEATKITLEAASSKSEKSPKP